VLRGRQRIGRQGQPGRCRLPGQRSPAAHAAAGGEINPADDAVIGAAGHNGLVAAGYLAQAEPRVPVLERREIGGGAAVTEELWPGYGVPTCPCICYLLQAEVIEGMYLPEHGFQVHRLAPTSFMPFPGSRAFVNWKEPERTAETVAAFSPRAAAAYPRYVALRERLSAILHRYFLTPPPTLAELVGGVRGTAAMRIGVGSARQVRRSAGGMGGIREVVAIWRRPCRHERGDGERTTLLASVGQRAGSLTGDLNGWRSELVLHSAGSALASTRLSRGEPSPGSARPFSGAVACAATSKQVRW